MWPATRCPNAWMRTKRASSVRGGTNQESVTGSTREGAVGDTALAFVVMEVFRKVAKEGQGSKQHQAPRGWANPIQRRADPTGEGSADEMSRPRQGPCSPYRESHIRNRPPPRSLPGR